MNSQTVHTARPGGIVVIATELVLNGAAHPEFFTPDQLLSELIAPSGSRLIEDIDFTLSAETLQHPVDGELDDMLTATPHIICIDHGVVWTSVLFFLQKP